VAVLQERLQLKVESAVQRQVAFFRDDLMPKSENLPSLLEKVADSRALLAIHSDNYVGEDAWWCREEVAKFLTQHGKRGVFKVEKVMVHPLDGMQQLQDYLGYQFWTQVDGRTAELLSEDALAYHRALSTLASDLAAFLAPPQGAERVLVLHEPLGDASDRANDRHWLKAQLESKGLCVEPPGRLARYRQQADLLSAAAACQAAVVLFNATYSLSLEEDWAALKDRPRLACFPSSGLDPRQMELAKRIELEQDQAPGRIRYCTLTSDAIELEIEKLLKANRPKPNSQLIYICGQQESKPFIERWRPHIEAQGFRVESLADRQSLERHRQAVAAADGILIVPNPQTSAFALSMGRDLKGRERIEKAFAAERAAEAPLFATQAPFSLLAEDTNTFQADLDAFLARLRARPTGKEAA
jgi:hypothetical protein